MQSWIFTETAVFVKLQTTTPEETQAMHSAASGISSTKRGQLRVATSAEVAMVTACIWEYKPERVPHLISTADCLEMSNLGSNQCRVKPAQQETTFLQFACLPPSHSLSLFEEAIFGQQNYARPLALGKVHLQMTLMPLLAHTTQPVTQAAFLPLISAGWDKAKAGIQPWQNWPDEENKRLTLLRQRNSCKQTRVRIIHFPGLLMHIHVLTGMKI